MKYCLLILFSLLIVFSCKKVEVPLSKQEKMRASDWRIDTFMITYLSYTGKDSLVESGWKRVEGGQEVSTKPDCLKDDYLKFRENYDGSHITGADKCATNETNDISFSWGLADADTKIYMYGLYSLYGQDVNANLIVFEDDNFSLAFPKKIATNGTDSAIVKVTYRFKKK